MPNWVSNKLQAESAVINSIIDEKSDVDFGLIVPLDEKDKNSNPRTSWGTKWNACRSTRNGDIAFFDTAWTCPLPFYIALSKKFPTELISVTYADEDIGSNCGTFKLLNGEMVTKDIAPYYTEQSQEERTKWREFAVNLKVEAGYDYFRDEE